MIVGRTRIPPDLNLESKFHEVLVAAALRRLDEPLWHLVFVEIGADRRISRSAKTPENEGDPFLLDETRVCSTAFGGL
jgi:hypothetical protein